MLEDLIVAAVNEALTQVDQAASRNVMSKLTRRHAICRECFRLWIITVVRYSKLIEELSRLPGHWSEVCAASGISPDPYA